MLPSYNRIASRALLPNPPAGNNKLYKINSGPDIYLAGPYNCAIIQLGTFLGTPKLVSGQRLHLLCLLTTPLNLEKVTGQPLSSEADCVIIGMLCGRV